MEFVSPAALGTAETAAENLWVDAFPESVTTANEYGGRRVRLSWFSHAAFIPCLSKLNSEGEFAVVFDPS